MENSIIDFSFVEPGQHRLPSLPYSYDYLEPVIDEKTMRFHHDVHHQAYVEGLNKAETSLVSAREENNFDYIKYWENELAFNGSGHILHSIYWTIMTKPDAGGTPGSDTIKLINEYFLSFDAFKSQFISAAKAVEGSGWAILAFNPAFGHLEILQCEKHQNLTQWGCIPILVCDVWEHAYYLSYQSKRADFIIEWWRLINWFEVERRIELARTGRLPLVLT